jgi:hypothetical protein
MYVKLISHNSICIPVEQEGRNVSAGYHIIQTINVQSHGIYPPG